MGNSHIIGNPDSAIWKMLGINDSKTTNTKQESINIARKMTENEKPKLVIHDKNDKIQK
ncbi:DUF2188 domain-containing protein [Clostridium sp. WILCCON 0269]|uniref:DUF2188 domain-containing protein n=1 Tax=Candidatus Clostridium eludens TaxID=3381663 RepID=A0ABW8SN45_9CLOT